MRTVMLIFKFQLKGINNNKMNIIIRALQIKIKEKKK